MADLVKVLSIDGGGIRGIMPAMVLKEIEGCTNKPIAESFDLIGGTSTGGILALGLAVPGRHGKPKYSAADLVNMYETEGREIFSRSIWHRMRAMGNLVEEKYPSDGLERVLAKYFGEARLKDALTEVLVTSYRIEARRPYFFKSHRARELAARDCLMRDAARATSAAPTYFEPHKLSIEGTSDYLALIDGGVFANNPALCAYVEAKDLFGENKDILLVSLGTGELTRPLPYEDVKGWGLASWAQPILSVVFDGVADAVDYQLRLLLSAKQGTSRRYFRFQTRLTEGSDDLDDAGPTNIRVLKLLADDLMRDKKDDLATLCDMLKS